MQHQHSNMELPDSDPEGDECSSSFDLDRFDFDIVWTVKVVCTDPRAHNSLKEIVRVDLRDNIREVGIVLFQTGSLFVVLNRLLVHINNIAVYKSSPINFN